MRNLGFRFVRHSTGLKPSDVAVHVVDPKVDFRSLFENVHELEKTLNKRKIAKIEVDEVARKYGRWWKMYETFEALNNEVEKKEFKNTLLKEEEGLIETLKLPNLLDCDHFLNNQVEKREIRGFSPGGSRLKVVDSLENSIFKAFSCMRLDPPRIVRPAITEAFNYSSSEVVRFHEGHNPAMHLVGK